MSMKVKEEEAKAFVELNRHMDVFGKKVVRTEQHRFRYFPRHNCDQMKNVSRKCWCPGNVDAKVVPLNCVRACVFQLADYLSVQTVLPSDCVHSCRAFCGISWRCRASTGHGKSCW